MRTCEIDNLSTCGKTSAAFSAAVHQSVSDCMASYECADGGDANERCLVTSLSQVTPTPKQSAVRQRFCAACALDAGARGCEDRFFFRTGRDGGMVPGPGSRVLLVNDTLAGKIEQACLPALADAGSACEGHFFFCANQAVGGAFPASSCRDAGR